MIRLLISTALLPCLLQTFAQFSVLGPKAKNIPCNKRSFFTFLFPLCFTILFAGPVTQQQAFEKAQRFMKSKKIKDDSKTNRTRGMNASQKNEPFYLFNTEDNQGFVIVSGDDRTEEILGYSDLGNIDLDNIPDNMKALFDIYRKEIKSLENKSTTKNVVRPTRNAVAPLIQTQWGQGSPYNLMCPEISGQHAVTGCGPTAIAQVLYHYKLPKTENPPLDGYGLVSEFPATTFNWENMRSDYKYGHFSESEAMAVAELMRYVGQKLQVGYGLNGTSLWEVFSCWFTPSTSKSNKVLSLFRDFGYNPNMAGIERRYTTRSYWEDAIYNEVYEGRPVLIGALGHEFVCDGYDGKGYFHLNWGWEGINDGYYLLTTIDSYEQNLSNNGNQLFIDNQTAYIGIRPSKEDDTYNYKILEGKGWLPVKNYYRNTTNHIFENVNFNMFFINFSDFLFNGDIGVGLFKDGCEISNIDRILSTEPFSINSFDVIEKNYSMDFDADIPNGSYVLLPIFKKKDDNEWRIASPNYYYLDISDELLSIYQTTPEWPKSQLVINDVLFDDILVKGEPCTIQIDFTNKNNDNYNRVWIYENEEIVQDFDDLIADFGQRKNQNISYTPKNEGVIKFSLRGPTSYSESGTSQEIYYEKVIDIYSNNQLAVDNVTAYIDNAASIGINLNNNTTDLTAYQFDLKLPTGFTLAKDSRDKFQVTKTSRYEDDSQQLTVSLQEDGSYRFISFSMSNGVIDGTSGAILNAVIEVADNVIVGTYEGTISNIIFTKTDGTQVRLIDTKFNIVVDKNVMGDANGDSEVNVADIVEIVNYILGKPSTKFVKAAADLNKDGDVNVTDIVMVVNIIMSAQNSSARNRSEKVELSTDNDQLTLMDIGNGSLLLSLENRGDYVASQFDVRLSEGQTLEGITLNGQRSGDHLMTYAKTGNNIYKVIVYSLSNDTFAGNSGELIDFKVKSSGNVRIENIVFVTAGHQEKWFAPLNSGTTGIEAIGQPSLNSDDCYDLQGRRVVNVGQKGIYIKNGKKYIVK